MTLPNIEKGHPLFILLVTVKVKTLFFKNKNNLKICVNSSKTVVYAYLFSL